MSRCLIVCNTENRNSFSGMVTVSLSMKRLLRYSVLIWPIKLVNQNLNINNWHAEKSWKDFLLKDPAIYFCFIYANCTYDNALFLDPVCSFTGKMSSHINDLSWKSSPYKQHNVALTHHYQLYLIKSVVYNWYDDFIRYRCMKFILASAMIYTCVVQ